MYLSITCKWIRINSGIIFTEIAEWIFETIPGASSKEIQKESLNRSSLISERVHGKFMEKCPEGFPEEYLRNILDDFLNKHPRESMKQRVIPDGTSAEIYQEFLKNLWISKKKTLEVLEESTKESSNFCKAKISWSCTFCKNIWRISWRIF